MTITHSAQGAWDSEDRDALRTFLEETRAGQKLAATLADRVPALLGSGDTNTIMIRMGEVRGAQEILKDFFTLAYPPVTADAAEKSPYPSLTDDSAWEDGHKITT